MFTVNGQSTVNNSPGSLGWENRILLFLFIFSDARVLNVSVCLLPVFILEAYHCAKNTYSLHRGLQ